MSGERITSTLNLLQIACCWLAVVTSCYGQLDSTASVVDSIRISPFGSDSIPQRPSPTPIKGFQPTKSAWLAVGLSALAPGAGQVYTGDYWKVPVILGLGGYWVSEWVHLNDRYQDFRGQYAASVTPVRPNGDDHLLNLRDFYRDQRDSFAWYIGALYFLNLVDAYVGANLYDFDVGSDLTADGTPYLRMAATLRLKF